MRLGKKLQHAWVRAGGYPLALIYVALTFALLVAKHDAFNTRVYDFARFAQAIWNTPENGFLFESILNRSILGDHFSPIMALAAPVLSLWPDERILFLIQALNVAVAGLLLYRIFHEQRPGLAPWFLLAFFLNPALHEVTLFEFRRIVFALPFLALALYALWKKERRLMLAALLVALLAKEDVGFYVFMIGFYLLLFERDRRWGLALMALGLGWVIVISVWVIPLFNPTAAAEGAYPQLYYFSYLGSSYEEIVKTVTADPLSVVRPLFQPAQLQALGRLLLPLGLVLPFLEPRWVLLALPYTVILLLSSDQDMIELVKWYPGTLLVVLFGAIAAGWHRLPQRWERPAMGLLVGAAASGFLLYSPAPGGGRYEPEQYRMTAHDRLAAQLLAQVPAGARVAGQPDYVPHLVLRRDVYHYPWIAIGRENVDMFVFDRQGAGYPFDMEEINREITDMVADTHNTVIAEADGLYLIARDADRLPSFEIGDIAGDWMRLERVELATRGEEELFENASSAPLVVRPGQELRVTLYWEALEGERAERSVSVRLGDETGWLFAQQDSMPVGGARPTSAWRPQETVRDVYYLSVPPDIPSGGLSLDVVVYDTYTQEVIPFAEAGEVLSIVPVVVDGGS